MKSKTVTLYICEFCKKKYFSKQACCTHEKFCFKRPENDHICFYDCEYLNIAKEEYPVSYYNGDDRTATRKAYLCMMHKKRMYTVVAERRGIVGKLQDSDDEIIRMPLKCNEYNCKEQSFCHDEYVKLMAKRNQSDVKAKNVQVITDEDIEKSW